jgi:hypothetical protein
MLERFTPLLLLWLFTAVAAARRAMALVARGLLAATVLLRAALPDQTAHLNAPPPRSR